MLLYCGKNRKGLWKATPDPDRFHNFFPIFETELNEVHENRVYMIKTYRGYTYGFGEGVQDDVSWKYQLFHSVSAAKKSKEWMDLEEKANSNPEEWHVTPFKISSDDHGKPFTYGDSKRGKMYMQIVPIRVIG